MSEEDRKTISDLKQLAEEGENPYYEDYDVLESRSRGYILTEFDEVDVARVRLTVANRENPKRHPRES
ncbi:hypothetical protein OHA40_16685 [Nocardia sp. NBC_00508]|uniref:hypothetical protein n=1 Tax=Nocardia sp. NBC_00508 TaxID=2975992 RepID=UPI002E812788|nr:hypothetical protein [Nocardia sp. NBC_00508]WUD69608.1 hypothetical protein OHA40_16685 [Nocardia sp. NBC_00508]